MMRFGGPWGWAMGGGWLFMLLLLGVVVALVLGVLRQFGDDRHERRMLGRGARDILDERYARGEIDADEYRRRRADLER